VNKKAPDIAGALVCWMETKQIRSVFGYTWAITAKFVADAASYHVDIRAGVGGDRGDTQVWRHSSLKLYPKYNPRVSKLPELLIVLPVWNQNSPRRQTALE
jgi:hypothetical protein